jgi:hypothetical protein
MTFNDELRKAFFRIGQDFERANEAFAFSGVKHATPQPLREVTINGKRFLIIEDEHGEYFQAVSDVPATRDEGQGQP